VTVVTVWHSFVVVLVRKRTDGEKKHKTEERGFTYIECHSYHLNCGLQPGLLAIDYRFNSTKLSKVTKRGVCVCGGGGGGAYQLKTRKIDQRISHHEEHRNQRCNDIEFSYINVNSLHHLPIRNSFMRL
jgi:hypothetical protein